jgi:ribosomal protein S18 acetylase RimI-like enzyme
MSTTEAISHIDSPSTIRPAVERDADAVFSLLPQLGNNYLPDRAAFDETFLSYLSAGEERPVLLVAEDAAGMVRGYALITIARLLYTNGDSAQLQELVVDESATGRGIGTMLVMAAEHECHKRGVRQLTVASQRAAMFYERLGYRSTSDFLKRSFD